MPVLIRYWMMVTGPQNAFTSKGISNWYRCYRYLRGGAEVRTYEKLRTAVFYVPTLRQGLKKIRLRRATYQHSTLQCIVSKLSDFAKGNRTNASVTMLALYPYKITFCTVLFARPHFPIVPCRKIRRASRGIVSCLCPVKISPRFAQHLPQPLVRSFSDSAGREYVR